MWGTPWARVAVRLIGSSAQLLLRITFQWLPPLLSEPFQFFANSVSLEAFWRPTMLVGERAQEGVPACSILVKLQEVEIFVWGTPQAREANWLISSLAPLR